MFVLPGLGVVSEEQWPTEGAGTVPMPAVSQPFICPSCGMPGELLQQRAPGVGRAASGGMWVPEEETPAGGVLGERLLPTKSPREQGRV